MFDPYDQWLGIPPQEQPPHYYRLLGIAPFEDNPQVINDSANRLLALLQQRASGENQVDAHRLQGELAAARLCLLDPARKSVYDAVLRGRLGTLRPSNQPQQAAASNDRRPPGRAVTPPPIAPPVQVPLPPPLVPGFPASGASDHYPLDIAGPARPAASRGRRRRQRRSPWILWLVGVALVAAAGLIALVAHLGLLRGPNEQKAVAAASPADTATSGKPAELPAAAQSPSKRPAAIFQVEIDPPGATLELGGGKGTVLGEGRRREVRVDDPAGPVTIRVTCKGYRDVQRSIDPQPGGHEDLRIVMERISEVQPPERHSAPTPRPTPHVDGSNEPADPLHDGNLLAGAVFAMPFDTDARGGFPFVAFSGRTYSAEARGGAAVEGKVGKALRLTKGSFLTIHGKFPSGQQPRTISVWLKARTGDFDQGYALAMGDSRGDSQIFSIQILRGNWCFSPHDRLPPLDTHVAVDAAWHHHCLVYDGRSLLYTIDAAPTAPVPLRLNTSSGDLCLGGLFGSHTPFNGDIDELMVYDRALTAMEIQQLYEMGEDGESVLGTLQRQEAKKDGKSRMKDQR